MFANKDWWARNNIRFWWRTHPARPLIIADRGNASNLWSVDVSSPPNSAVNTLCYCKVWYAVCPKRSLNNSYTIRLCLAWCRIVLYCPSVVDSGMVHGAYFMVHGARADQRMYHHMYIPNLPNRPNVPKCTKRTTDQSRVSPNVPNVWSMHESPYVHTKHTKRTKRTADQPRVSPTSDQRMYHHMHMLLITKHTKRTKHFKRTKRTADQPRVSPTSDQRIIICTFCWSPNIII